MVRSRRDVLRSGAALSALVAAGVLSPAELRALPARSAFDARSLADALAAIGGTPADSKALLIDVPEVAEDGAIVPVSVISKLPNTEEIHVLVEKNRWPLAASFKLGRQTELAHRGALQDGREHPGLGRRQGRRPAVQRGARDQGHGRRLRRLREPFTGSEGTNMAEPMRIRATQIDDVTDVKVLMAHPMETGLRQDGKGGAVPAHYITEVTVTHRDVVVLQAMWGPSVAKNPFLGFRFRGAAKGDKLSVAWVDNKGDRRSDTAVIG